MNYILLIFLKDYKLMSFQGTRINMQKFMVGKDITYISNNLQVHLMRWLVNNLAYVSLA